MSVCLLPLTLLIPLLQKFIMFLSIILGKLLLFPLLKLFPEFLFIFVLLSGFFPCLPLGPASVLFPPLLPVLIVRLLAIVAFQQSLVCLLNHLEFVFAAALRVRMVLLGQFQVQLFEFGLLSGQRLPCL